MYLVDSNLREIYLDWGYYALILDLVRKYQLLDHEVAYGNSPLYC